ncbi:hypothetical protein EON81_10920 [bacterium]|nr:MAG: hypothetical protein EON81_10920 [bacterium]
MSFDIPHSIEPAVKRYARAQRISEDEAIVRLIRKGLEDVEPNAIEAGLGLFGSPEDAAALDAAVTIAYEERHQPSNRATSI